jgi:hypothetical protein
VINEGDFEGHKYSDCTNSSSARQDDLAFEGVRDFIDIVKEGEKQNPVIPERFYRESRTELKTRTLPMQFTNWIPA